MSFKTHFAKAQQRRLTDPHKAINLVMLLVTLLSLAIVLGMLFQPASRLNYFVWEASLLLFGLSSAFYCDLLKGKLRVVYGEVSVEKDSSAGEPG